MTTDLTLLGDSPFDAIRRTDERGEYWSARDLMPVLGYEKWYRFADSIERARAAMANAGQDADREASRVREAFGLTRQPGDNFRLSRHACYLVAMNGDPRKPEIAAAQTYFAVKTREAEVVEPTRTQIPSHVEALRGWANEIEAREAAEARSAELEPAANSWQQLADADGDYAVADAAKVLSRDPNIQVGRDRLFEYLETEAGWIFRGEAGRFRAYQRVVDAGWLAERLQSSPSESGVRVARAPQVRVTVKGLHRLHVVMGGHKPLLLGVAS